MLREEFIAWAVSHNAFVREQGTDNLLKIESLPEREVNGKIVPAVTVAVRIVFKRHFISDIASMDVCYQDGRVQHMWDERLGFLSIGEDMNCYKDSGTGKKSLRFAAVAPPEPEVTYNTMPDGDQWICTGEGFINLMESDNYAFGATEEEAIENFKKLSETVLTEVV